MQSTTRTPDWWTDKHASDWDHVKGALERDWEQTKADFSKNTGQSLNQNVADTVKQSVGSEPIPSLDVKTRPTDPKVAAQEAEKARENMEKVSVRTEKTVSKAHDAITREHAKLSEQLGEVRDGLVAQQAKASEKRAEAQDKASDRIADAQDKALGGIAKLHAKIEEARAKRNEAIAKWRDAEQEVRYGYSVRSRYPANYLWDDKLEGTLLGEWDALDPGMSWNVSKTGIRRGWDYAGLAL
jgi:hypothetical protein